MTKRRKKDRIDTINILGKRYGYLTVIDRIYDHSHRGAKWKCLCDCGKETTAQGGQLRAGGRVSCGCKAEKKIQETGVKRLFSMYKTKAKNRKIPFDLNIKEFEKLISSKCYYCKCEPKQILKRLKTNKAQIFYNGIDRIDSNYGYSPLNCVSACRICNQSKSNLSFDDWKSHILRLAKCLQDLS